MQISLNWLKEFVDCKKSGAEVGDLLTEHTAEVEGAEDQATNYKNMVVGKVTELKKHPGADKLSLNQVDIGEKDPVQLVCGGENLKEGMLVAIALPGANVRWHGEGELVELSEAKIRGEKSFGMICAGEEIGLASDNPPDAKEVRIKDLSHLNVKPGTPLAEALNKNDVALDIDNKSLTHRPDLWGHYGMARELAAILKTPLKPYEDLTTFKPGKVTETLTIKIEDSKISPLFSGCIMTNVTIKESPQWIKSRLQAVGVNPISNVVDITNLVMVELGQPMHAYDRKVVENDTLVVRFAKEGEELETIDHKKRKLTAQDPLVTNGKKAMGLAGIMGGAGSEISDDTTEVIFEAANWDPIIVRKSSTRHGLRSDASQRFEKGLDPNLAELAVKRAINLLQECDPDCVLSSEITTMGDWKYQAQTITLNPTTACNKIGVEISTPDITKILESLDFTVTTKKELLEVTVPSHRATGDVSIEEDLVEEIARMHGYNEIPAILPDLPIRLPLKNEARMHKHDARNILAHSLGFTEAMHYSFYNEEMFKKCGLENMRHIKVFNYLSSDQTHMRVSLVPGMLKSIAQNSKIKSEMRLFEIGRTYKEIGEFMPLEEKWLIGAFADQSKDEIFYKIKGAFDAFIKEFKPKGVMTRPSTTPPSYAHPKKCLEVLQRGNVIGHIFTLHPGVAQAFELEHNVGLFELNFTKLVEHGRDIADFEELPKFPSMPFDVSILIDRKKQVLAVEKAIKKGDKNGLVRNIQLFDTYEGKGIPEDKKSLAFNIELRHDERTMNDKEFHETKDSIFKSIGEIGGEVRGN
jgi:phenylalanyl-tRNA synthetase beta chain